MTRLQKIKDMDQALMSCYLAKLIELPYCKGKENCPKRLTKDEEGWTCRDCVYDWLGEEI